MEKCIFETIIGKLKLEYKDDIVYSLQQTNEEVNNKENNITKEIKEYLNKERESFTFKYEITGTKFQQEVYKQLIKIPYGKTCSYKDIAIKIGNPNASRAVGNANNKNKLLIIIPCHRVIGGNNKLVGYRLGLDVKEKLLKIEGKYNDK